MQFQVRAGGFEFRAALFHLFEIHANGPERLRQGDAIAVREAARLVQVQIAGAGGGTKQTFSKTRALLIRPIHQPHGDRRPAGILCIEAAQNFQTGQQVQAAIQPAAVGDRIQVTADDQRAPGATG